MCGIFRRITIRGTDVEIVIGVTGATGAVYAARLLEVLRDMPEVNTHLIVSEWGERTLETETEMTGDDLRALATHTYSYRDMGAKTSSGSFLTDGMIIMPCSMKTLSAIAHGYDDNLISRTAGVMLKEGRRLVLSPRETPLSAIHLENMLKLAKLGVRLVPPMPAFYNKPETLESIIDFHVTKVLDSFGIHRDSAGRWAGGETL